MAAIMFSTAHQPGRTGEQVKTVLRSLRHTKTTAAIRQGGAYAGSLTIDEAATVTAPFQPLDSSIVNETIPAFFIGRNNEGLWVAREVTRRVGGIFLFESSAVAFAKRHGGPAGCATIYPAARFELDLDNSGNPLVPPLWALLRLMRAAGQRMGACIGDKAVAIKRRFSVRVS